MTIGISKIMVGIDGSEESVNVADYAIAIAKRHNAELIAPLTIREIILLAEDGEKKWFNEIKEKADQSSIRFMSVIMAKNR
jgi:nucleotide-binding universal stress UspA family protein